MSHGTAAVQELEPILQELKTQIIKIMTGGQDPPKKGPNSTWMHTHEVAQELGVSQRAVAQMIQRGTLPESIVKRPGRKFLINRKGFQEFMEQQ